MSDDFLARLREGRLTCTEQYRQIQDAMVLCELEDSGAESDEWKTWQLTPATGAFQPDSRMEGSIIDTASDSGKNVLQAIKALDKSIK